MSTFLLLEVFVKLANVSVACQGADNALLILNYKFFNTTVLRAQLLAVVQWHSKTIKLIVRILEKGDRL